ncbi:hypothetical protein BJX70DRAFT_395095 [Aspergillus crustosus]
MAPNLHSLSLELIDLIIYALCDDGVAPTLTGPDYADLHPEKLSAYATISRSWQYAIERWTFARIHTSSTDLSRVHKSMTAHPRRIHLIRALHYTINLPRYSTNRRYRVERRREHRANLVAFRQGVIDLWSLLQAWQPHGFPRGLQLVLVAESPTEVYSGPLGSQKLEARRAERWAHLDHSLTLHDDDEEPLVLPALSFIGRLLIGITGRRIHPAAIGDMLNSLTRLSALSVRVPPVKPKRKGLHAEMRNALARALEAPTLNNLKRLRLDLGDSAPENHDFQTAHGEDPDYPNGDHLSRALCKLAQASLQRLELDSPAVLSPVLFGVDSLHPDRQNKTFPFLQSLLITMAPMTYDGRWYFTGDSTEAISDEDEDSMDEDALQAEPPNWEAGSNSSYNSAEKVREVDFDRERYLDGEAPTFLWRFHPDPSTFEPFVRALLSAIPRMPRLSAALLFSNALSLRAFCYGVALFYASPSDFVATGTGADGDTPRRAATGAWNITTKGHTHWELPSDIRDLMQQQVGDEGLVSQIQVPLDEEDSLFSEHDSAHSSDEEEEDAHYAVDGPSPPDDD